MVLRRGHLEQAGAPQELYRRPRNAFVAGFLGEVNLRPLTPDAAGEAAPLPGDAPLRLAPGGAATLVIRPEDIRLVEAAPTARVTELRTLGHVDRLVLALEGGGELIVYQPSGEAPVGRRGRGAARPAGKVAPVARMRHDARWMLGLGGARRPVELAIVAGAAAALLVVAQAALLGRVIDGAFLKGVGWGALRAPLLLLVLVALGRAAAAWASDTLALRAAGRAKVALRRKLAARVVELGPHGLSNRPAGEIANLLGPGAEALDGYVGSTCPSSRWRCSCRSSSAWRSWRPIRCRRSSSC